MTPTNVLSFNEIISVVKFLENYTEQYTILLPARIPAYKRDDMKLLPSSNSNKVLELGGAQNFKMVRYFIKYHDINNYHGI